MGEPSPAAVAGAVAGGVALLVFVTLHAVWIVPIWPMLTMLPIAALVGAVAAWPFQELTARGALPPPPIDGLALVAVLLATLVPTVVFGVIAGPVDQQRITWQGVLAPLLLAAPAGAVIGLLMTGSTTGAAALAIAATALALTLGHNLPFFPLGSPAWEKAFALVAIVELAAGVAFSAARALAAVASSGFTVGLLIALRQRGNVTGWLLLVVGLYAALSGFAQEYATSGIVVRPGSLPWALEAAWVNSRLWVFFAAPMLTLVPQLFPTGRPLTSRWRPLFWGSFAFIPMALLVFGLRPGPLENAAFAENPFPAMRADIMRTIDETVRPRHASVLLREVR